MIAPVIDLGLAFNYICNMMGDHYGRNKIYESKSTLNKITQATNIGIPFQRIIEIYHRTHG